MDRVSISGRMEESMSVIMKMIRSVGLVNTIGMTVVYLRDIGRMGKEMERVE